MRLKLGITTVVVALLGALTITMGAGTGVAAATTSAAATPSWGPTQPYDVATATSTTFSGTGMFTFSVACLSYGNCVAAGLMATSTTNDHPAVAVETGAGQWGQAAMAALPADAESGVTPEFTSVACSTATSCVAVGAYNTSDGEEPLAVPFTISGASVTYGTPQRVSLPSGASTSGQGAFLSGVSCGSGGCTAVGTYETASSVWTAITATAGAGGAWTATAVTPPSGASNDNVLNAISCPSSGACEAVGNYEDGSNDRQQWAVEVTNGVAGHAQPVTISNEAPSSDSPPALEDSDFTDLSEGLTAVSCPSAGVCTAAGGVLVSIGSSSLPAASLVPITGGTPGQSALLQQNGGPAFAILDSISCSDASDCTAVGLGASGDSEDSAIAATETGGSWAAPWLLQPSSGGTSILNIDVPESVACTSPGICVSGGINEADSATDDALSLSQGSFFAYSAFAPTITSSSLPPATVGQAYSATLQSSGGTGTAGWAVTLGSLPAGLTLDSATGVISGTPTTAGQNGILITTTNAGPPSLSATLSTSITVGPAATVTAAYSKLSAHSAMIIFTCSGAPCQGSLKLTGVEHLRGKRPIAVDAKAKKRPAGKRTVTLDSRSYSIKPGASQVIKVKLNATGMKLLRELHKISGQLTLTPTGASKPALIKILKFRS